MRSSSPVKRIIRTLLEICSTLRLLVSGTSRSNARMNPKVLPQDEYDALFDYTSPEEEGALMDEVGHRLVVKATTTLRQRILLYVAATESGTDDDEAMERYGLGVCYPQGQKPQLYIKELAPISDKHD